MQPSLPISREERLKADALFEIYRRARKPGEPVGASAALFRYADYPSMYWMDRLNGRPKLVWVLADLEKGFPDEEAYSGYERFAQDGRFAILRLKSSAAELPPSR
jgi:hypothetical protein